jgi:hypothetical protein
VKAAAAIAARPSAGEGVVEPDDLDGSLLRVREL